MRVQKSVLSMGAALCQQTHDVIDDLIVREKVSRIV